MPHPLTTDGASGPGSANDELSMLLSLANDDDGGGDQHHWNEDEDHGNGEEFCQHLVKHERHLSRDQPLVLADGPGPFHLVEGAGSWSKQDLIDPNISQLGHRLSPGRVATSYECGLQAPSDCTSS